MQYKPTTRVNYGQLDTVGLTHQVGQWITLPSGARGQYLGETHAGPVINWVRDKFTQQHAKANKALRQYARVYGKD